MSKPVRLSLMELLEVEEDWAGTDYAASLRRLSRLTGGLRGM